MYLKRVYANVLAQYFAAKALIYHCFYKTIQATLLEWLINAMIASKHGITFLE